MIGALESRGFWPRAGPLWFPHAAGTARRLFFGRRVGEGGRLFFVRSPLFGVAIAVIRGWVCGGQRRGGPAAERWGASGVHKSQSRIGWAGLGLFGVCVLYVYGNSTQPSTALDTGM